MESEILESEILAYEILAYEILESEILECYTVECLTELFLIVIGVLQLERTEFFRVELRVRDQQRTLTL